MLAVRILTNIIVQAYEAEAFLVGATESHEQAQAALNAKANVRHSIVFLLLA